MDVLSSGLTLRIEISMESSELGIMIISMIGLFGFASFVFEYLSARRSKKSKPQ
ncbi:hypothetical protein [Pseudomonas sp. Sample_22]|uniref:hypothetical protein n=1 Tax=Pseudomonas sp. Sample_22 TaxID=2448266 RepID=UPI0015AFD757|nr:hypothetical protein [Pseudomonas sp. Sample_22]